MKKGEYVVYGGSGYIGSAIVRRLCAEGFGVVATYCTRRPPARSDDEVRWLRCDIMKDDDLDRLRGYLAENVPALEGVAFACAPHPEHVSSPSGITGDFAHPEVVQGPVFQQLMDFFSLRLYQALMAPLDFLKKGENPNILVIGSLVGRKAVPLPVHFAMAKASLRGLVESFSKGLGRYRIKVNSVDPGILAGGAGGALPDQIKESYLTHCALRRFGTAEEIAEWACWMLTENTYITGKSILVDGGL